MTIAQSSGCVSQKSRGCGFFLFKAEASLIIFMMDSN